MKQVQETAMVQKAVNPLDQGPPAEIRFDFKGGDVVIVHTRRLPSSPNYVYEARWTRPDGSQSVIWEAISWPSEDDIKTALRIYKGGRKT